MHLYLLLICPALAIALLSSRITRFKLIVLWAATFVLMIWLIPIGSRDYATYLRDFGDLNELKLIEVLRQDPLYTCAVWLFGHLGIPAGIFYLLWSGIGLWIKLTALQRLSGDSSLAILLYICSYFFLHDFTQLRAGLAIGIWMHALAELRFSRVRYLLFTTLASLIHLQALLGFALFGFLMISRSRFGVLLLSVGTLVIFTMANMRILEHLGYGLIAVIPDARTDIYLGGAEQGIWVRPNPYSLISLVALTTALIGLHLGKRVSLQLSVSGTNQIVPRAIFIALLLGVCSLSVLAAVPVAAFRVSEHFFSLLPVAIWLLASSNRVARRYTIFVWPFGAAFAYIFLFYGHYLLDPTIDALNQVQ